MKKIIFAIVAVIAIGLVASQAIAGTCTKTVGSVTYKKYCTGPIVGWTYNPGAKEKEKVLWVPWDEVLEIIPRDESLRIASINNNIYTLRNNSYSGQTFSYSLYKDDSLVKNGLSSREFPEWDLSQSPELKNYLLNTSFISFDSVNSSGTIKNHKFKRVLPVAKAGNGQSVRPGDTVTLDGSASYIKEKDQYYCENQGGEPKPCPLVYQWSFVSKPPNSTATLSGAALEKPTFVADLAGNYMLKLVVSSSEAMSPADKVIIRARIKRPVR